MKNLFEQFANGGGKVTSEGLSVDFRANLYGTTTITKGGLSFTMNFYAFLDRGSIKNMVTLDDFDETDSCDYNFNGVPVDDIRQLKNTLKESGLSTVSESLDVTWKDQKFAVAKEIEKDKLFKKIYGKDAFLWDALTQDEQYIKGLEHAIENYEKVGASHWYIKDFATEEPMLDDDGNTVLNEKTSEPVMIKVKPTLERLQELLVELKNK